MRKIIIPGVPFGVQYYETGGKPMKYEAIYVDYSGEGSWGYSQTSGNISMGTEWWGIVPL